MVRSSSTIKLNIGLIHIGSCPLHLIHNSFKIGIDSTTNWSIEEFLNNLAFWFSRSPSRREDYLKVAKYISNDIGKFIRRFIITRWLDAGPIMERIIKQWTNLNEYFIKFIPINQLDIGEATRLGLNNLSNEENKQFFSDIRNIYSSITKELTRTLPLNNDLLRHLKCLHPMMRHSETSHISIMNIARSFPQMIVPDEIDRITAEWYLYQNENIPNEWYEKTNEYHAIDYYWKNIFTLKTNTGTDKFIALPKLIKCVLALSHGNADVERGFSENAFLLTDDRSLLSDASINGLRATRDGVKFFGNGKPHEVPITKALLDSVRGAHSRYCIDLEKRQQELLTNKNLVNEEKQNDFFIEKQNDLYDEQKCLHKNLTNIQKMIDEGTERLTSAISSKDFKEIETSLLLIEGGNEKLAMTTTHIVCNSSKLNQLKKKQKK
ncbi:unnamed protein product [Rotaria sp. Silwood2]|nr:unnamed protein product [Rotaria sp. Silwood2]